VLLLPPRPRARHVLTAALHQGNTGDLGAAFGMLYAVGQPFPFPEAQPWRKSWQYEFFSFLGNLAQRK